MLAVYAQSISRTDPLSGLVVGERPDPEPQQGWVEVELKAATLNHHDLWSLQGVGLPESRLPMILGCDAAGIGPDGQEVIAHSVIPSPGWSGDETLDPKRSLLSEVHQGTFSERFTVPAANLVPKPEGMSWETAASLPTAWLTAYRMLFTNSGVTPGGLVLVQGAGGGVATACIQLGAAAGLRVWVTGRDEAKMERAVELGAEAAFPSGERLPEKVDAVIETVGAATWSHSVNVLRPGGAIVIAGATSGDAPTKAELTKIFFRQLRVIGSTMGNRTELLRLAKLMQTAGIEPVIDSTYPLADARSAFERLESGENFGKVALTA
ncbi:NADPH:quinone reductase-like Zn-dependent oxidoreductase [Kineosphaera limosa]|uniref:Putative oxidoreductase n=1 Tax=Kineosphaera limosa NBRC 100340 TaxID=1184609 RepID=K6WTC0_9MICO|nr:zinc-binding dehydrogenase [Kineosphaera limosa]NYE01995.1 NADPH:quinone reductase-like Zn-dependent oxidoreductase [Kineosphaera limosa]GAB97101.1 putative oxidoreductase [Kineosphaera limosa NBRC 100340]